MWSRPPREDHSIFLLTNDLFNMYGNASKLIPRSTYRKNVGEGIRTITYGAHTSLVASDRSGKFVTNVTSAVGHEVCLLQMPQVGDIDARKVSIFEYYRGSPDYWRVTASA